MKIAILLVMSVWAITCKGQIKNEKKNFVPKDCVRLNDSAFAFLLKYENTYQRQYNDKRLDTALDLLKQAVKCDSAFTIAYINMANTYNDMYNLDAEIQILNKLINLTHNNPKFILRKAQTFKYQGKKDSAKRAYAMVDSLYDKQLQRNPENINVVIDKIYLRRYTQGLDAAYNELMEQVKKHPKDSVLLMDQKKFLKNGFYEETY
jgi:tetratricopeptide (TPR) repeat protein